MVCVAIQDIIYLQPKVVQLGLLLKQARNNLLNKDYGVS